MIDVIGYSREHSIQLKVEGSKKAERKLRLIEKQKKSTGYMKYVQEHKLNRAEQEHPREQAGYPQTYFSFFLHLTITLATEIQYWH